MSRIVPLALLCLPLTGCIGGGFKGVYLLHVPAPADDATCDTTVKDHNFSDGEVPDQGDTQTGDWTYDTSGTFSDKLLFLQIIDAANGETLLLMGDQVFPGSKIGGSYTFTWDHFSDGTDSQENVNDYKYITEGSQHQTSTFLILKKGDTINGTATVDQTTNQTYTETDEWVDYDVGVYYGQIPASNYLVDSDGLSISNDPDVQDCDNTSCTIEIESHCTQSLSFTGEQTSVDPDAYDQVDTAGQTGGWESGGYNPY
jgi:hypothetical protein